MDKLGLIFPCILAGSVALLLPCAALGGLLCFAYFLACGYDLDWPGMMVGLFGLPIMGLCILLVAHVIHQVLLTAFKGERPLTSSVRYNAAGSLLLLCPVWLSIAVDPTSAWLGIIGSSGYLVAIAWLYSCGVQPDRSRQYTT